MERPFAKNLIGVSAVTVAPSPRATVRMGDPHVQVGLDPNNGIVSAWKIEFQELG